MAQDFILEKRPLGSEKNEPKVVGDVLKEYFASNEPLAVAYRERTTESEKQGWNPNTYLSVDLKTLLRSDSKMKTGKNYQGILRRDEICEEFRYDEHFTFVETVPQTAGKRNPHVFDGQYITVTRRDDGSLRLNFKELPKGANFDLERFALGVYNELCLALGGLIEGVE